MSSAVLKLGPLLILLAEPATPPPPKAEGNRFQLQLVQLARCQPPAGPADPHRSWVGVSVEVRSKTRGLFVTPRDFSLEKQGIVLAPRHINPPLLQRCLPLLRPKQIDAGQEPLRGFVLFEVPTRLRQDDKPLTLAYRPTIWGGAQRLEITIPACLDECDSPRTSGAQAPGNSGAENKR